MVSRAIRPPGLTFCAVQNVATKLRRNFPRSLNGAPALLPTTNMGMRMALEAWFDKNGISPRLVGEFEDSALMEVCSSGGRGFTVVHTVIDRAAQPRRDFFSRDTLHEEARWDWHDEWVSGGLIQQ